MTSPYDDLSPRAAWFMENFDSFGLAEICASSETHAAKIANLRTFITQGREQGAKGITWNTLETLLDQPAAGAITVLSDTVIHHEPETGGTAGQDSLARARRLAAEWQKTCAQLGAMINMDEAADALLAALDGPQESP